MAFEERRLDVRRHVARGGWRSPLLRRVGEVVDADADVGGHHREGADLPAAKVTQTAHEMQAAYRRQQPLASGIIDLARLENR